MKEKHNESRLILFSDDTDDHVIFSCSDKPDLSEERVCRSKLFDIFISDVNCQNPGDCNHVQAIIIDKREKNAQGESINIGFGRNLRGYVICGNQYIFEIRQPETKLDEQVDLNK